MGENDELIKRIVGAEWEMFHDVSNIGGRASCQESPRTFEINRIGQFVSWSKAALESYLDDLTEAKRTGRNLLAEKYARMMKKTSPAEYARIAHMLPPLSPEASPLIDEIAEIVIEWEEDVSSRYPHILGRGRPLRSSEDTRFVTSFETYLMGELASYSPRTLRLYRDHVKALQAAGKNGSEATLDYVVRRHGFGSLEEADERLGARA